MVAFRNVEYPDTKLPCNRENMTKLVEALESDEYKQGTGALKVIKDDGKEAFCCAGVACDVSGVGAWDGETYLTAPSEGRDTVLPGEVVDWLGIEDLEDAQYLPLSAMPPEGDFGEALCGTAVNDSGAWDFKRIAARLREVYLTD